MALININRKCAIFLYLSIRIIVGAKKLELPGSCQSRQYYEPSTLSCQSCPVNASMITSADGFSCSCQEHSIPSGIRRCRPCNATEVVSSDGTSCVPRRCQTNGGKTVCRKCPSDYITVTQNLDGSSLKEVQCVKCARGFKASNNICVRCESCICARNQLIIRDKCVPKSYVNQRPKYEENTLHPFELLNIVKNEYFCMQNDVRLCRKLAHQCVTNFYSTDLAGPCRLWIQSNLAIPKDLPSLTVESTLSDKTPGETSIPRGNDHLLVSTAVYTSDGKFEMHKGSSQEASPCLLPLNIRIGRDLTHDCQFNVSKLNDYLNMTISPFLFADESLIQIPVYPRKPNGYNVQRGSWISNKFRRYFVVNKYLSTTTNTTDVVYLRTMEIQLQIERDKGSQGTLRVHITVEVTYAKKPLSADSVMMTLKVTHIMPEAGVHRGLEIWGGVLGCLLTLYALMQWRGVVRRGGFYFSLVPLLATSLADTFYFAAWFSTLHALAAEAGTLGLTLPLSKREEHIIRALIYTAVALKAAKVLWINFNQCRCDIFFLDWSEYNPPYKEQLKADKCNSWRGHTLARAWSSMQTIRRVSPVSTSILTLLISHVMTPWQSYLPPSQAYHWAVASIAWWASFSILLSARWIADRVLGSSLSQLPKICRNVGMSLLVFQEDYYAHYLHGRNDDSKDLRTMAGPLAACRIVCAPQLRIVYKQLSLSVPVLGETETRQALLSGFLAAFLERALDGLSWVAGERTVLERLLDVELVTREAGNTSTLLYDPEDGTPSCFAVTWWGEEWSLATFDAMLFGCILVVTNDILLAALLTVVVWQIMVQLRSWFGNKNQVEKTDIEL